MQNEDNRLQALHSWIAQVLDARDFDIRSASADASFRRFFRVSLGPRTYIAMDAPPDKEDARRFVEIARRFYEIGLNVPEVFAQEMEKGFLLLSDLGDRLYLGYLNENTVERLYGDALGALVVLQTGIYTDSRFLPDYSESLLRYEVELFREWYLERHLGLTLGAREHSVLDRTFDILVRSALQQPKVWVHRDYHSRNLLVTEINNPGIVDFQDAVQGPVTYDLVSLLRDCYIAWPRERVEDWVRGYHTLALRSGVPACEDEELFLKWFDWMGIQRHLKAAGIFARLNHRDAKPSYLHDIPRTLGYVREVCGRYPDLKSMYDLLCTLKVPVP